MPTGTGTIRRGVHQFMGATVWYNPAAAGVYGQLDVHAAYSQQMAGFSGAPATMALTADLPLWFFGPSHGAGLGFMNDKAGLFTTKKIYLQYAITRSWARAGSVWD